MPPRVFNIQVVQGASEPGGHQAAGGHGRLCSRVPGAFSQPAGEHADQDQSCWWVNLIYTNIYNWLNVPDFVDRDRMFFLECISPLFWQTMELLFFAAKGQIFNSCCFMLIWRLDACHRDLQRAVLGVCEEQVWVWDPGCLPTLGGERSTHESELCVSLRQTTFCSHIFLPLQRRSNTVPQCPLPKQTALTHSNFSWRWFLMFFFQPVCLVCVSQSEKLLLFDTVQSELEEKIRRLEEDRHSIDITSGTDRGCNQQLSEMSFLIIYQIKTIRGWASSDILTSGQHLQND